MSDRVWNVLTAIAALATAAVVVVVVYAIFFTGPTPIEEASTECKTATQPLDAGDEGKSLEIDATSEASFQVVDCVLDELDAPDSLRSKIESTRAIDGRESDSWDDFEASWTYHPDDGLDLIIEAD